MLISDLVMKDKNTLDRYVFYRGLGYSVEASELLSCVTYGDYDLACAVARYKKGDIIQNVRAWLERKINEPAKSSTYSVERYCLSYASPIGDSCGYGAAPPSPAPPAPHKAAKASFTVRSFSSALYSLTQPFADMADEEDFFDRGLSPEALATDAYEPIEEKDAKGVFNAPTSTFRMTTSNASMGILFNQLRSGRYIEMDQVRIEEILSAFDYNVEVPKTAKFAISTELKPKGQDKKLLFVHVQACEEQREHQNIVVLLDVSGSMYDNAEVTQATLATILSKLHPGDKFSLVTYSNEDYTVVDGYTIKDEQDKEHLMGLLLGLEIDGGTYGSAGIETAYAIGAKYYRDDWSNQVMLITDGDLNFGITSKGGLKELIEEKKMSGLFLSVIGTGLYNYKDENLEVLAKHGNGTYCVVNALADVTESINKRYIALTNIIAKDVKAQVEFNPKYVRSYRLLGYENRELAHEDFRNDAVISEPYGSGGHGVALYELTMGNGEPETDLKYQVPVLTGSDELCTVKIRYKDPLADVSREIEKVVYNEDLSTDNLDLAWLLYCVSEKLRESDKLDVADEEYLKQMLTDNKYKALQEKDSEKLTLFVEAKNLNRKRRPLAF